MKIVSLNILLKHKNMHLRMLLLFTYILLRMLLLPTYVGISIINTKIFIFILIKLTCSKIMHQYWYLQTWVEFWQFWYLILNLILKSYLKLLNNISRVTCIMKLLHITRYFHYCIAYI